MHSDGFEMQRPSAGRGLEFMEENPLAGENHSASFSPVALESLLHLLDGVTSSELGSLSVTQRARLLRQLQKSTSALQAAGIMEVELDGEVSQCPTGWGSRRSSSDFEPMSLPTPHTRLSAALPPPHKRQSAALPNELMPDSEQAPTSSQGFTTRVRSHTRSSVPGVAKNEGGVPEDDGLSHDSSLRHVRARSRSTLSVALPDCESGADGTHVVPIVERIEALIIIYPGLRPTLRVLYACGMFYREELSASFFHTTIWPCAVVAMYFFVYCYGLVIIGLAFIEILQRSQSPSTWVW
jgi:hypothetical protein